MNIWPKKWTCKGKRNGEKFRLHQRIPCEGYKWGYDCHTPSMFNSKEDAELFSKEFKESLTAAIQSNTQDISEHPWTGIFIEKVKNSRCVPKYVSEWIEGYEEKSGTGAKRTASKQTRRSQRRRGGSSGCRKQRRV